MSRDRSPYQFTLVLLVGAWLAMEANIVAAQNAATDADSRLTLTNLSQLGSYLSAPTVKDFDVRVQGIVTWCSADGDEFVLQDETGAACFHCQLAGKAPPARQTGLLEGKVALGKGRAVLRQLLQIENDGLHGMNELTARKYFKAGQHPFVLDYFQGGLGYGLKINWQGPAFSKMPIPAEALFHDDGTNLLSGLQVDYYQGDWSVLPDFGGLKPVRSLVATNLAIIEPNSGTNFGLRFRGSLKIPIAGEYRFGLASDDGSQLTFLESLWKWTSLNETPMPKPQVIVPGQPLSEDQNYRWSEVRGEAGFVAVWGDRCVFDLVSEVSRMRVELADGGGNLAELLPHARVRMQGVCSGNRQGSESLLATELRVPSEDDVVIESLPSGLWRRFEARSVSELSRETNAGMFRVSGTVRAVQEGRQMTLESQTNRLVIKAVQARANWQGALVEVLVDIGKRGDKPVVAAKAVRVLREATPESVPLVSVDSIRTMPLDELRKYKLVRIRGVVISEFSAYSITVHDGDYAISCWSEAPRVFPRTGELVEVEGHAREGAFGPNIAITQVTDLGRGVFPQPITPTWSQLINGSLEQQWVELEGVVQNVSGNRLTMGMVGGQIEVEMTGGKTEDLDKFQDAIVRVRGTVVPIYNDRKQIERVKLRVNSPFFVELVTSPVADPFAVPHKTIEELTRFDPASANPFYRVQVYGQVIYADDAECYLISGDKGLRFVLKLPAGLAPGDWVDVVGYPRLGGTVPQLIDAVARLERHEDLPPPPIVTPDQFFNGTYDSKRVAVEGAVLSIAQGQSDKTLELRLGARFLTVRVRNGMHEPLDIPLGSRVRITGTCAGRVLTEGTRARDSYELLVNRVSDVVVLARPPWWTVTRILILVGILVAVLLVSVAWIVLLQRKVEQRTAELDREMRQRKEAELQRASEQERSRIARDLHDDLGASLTEISLLAGLGQNQTDAGESSERFDEIGSKARSLVNSLDVIVWAADPEEDDLETFADYVTGFARMFLDSSGVVCRFKVPIEFPQLKLDGRVRHDLFLAIKETLNNIVRHAHATEVEFGLKLDDGHLQIQIVDNGCGYDASRIMRGNGLINLQERLSGIGGRCEIESCPGHGTKVKMTLDLQASA